MEMLVKPEHDDVDDQYLIGDKEHNINNILFSQDKVGISL